MKTALTSIMLATLTSIISFSALANRAPLSAIEKYINSPVPVAGVTCEERPEDQCIDFSHIEGWEVSELIDETMDEPIYSAKENVTDCETVESCEELRASLCAEDYQFFYAENLILSGYEAYCTKVTGYNKVPTGRKLLQTSPEKKAVKAAKEATRAQVSHLIQEGKKAREACQRVLDLIGGFNLLPSRTSGQTDQMTTTFEAAKVALQDGRPGKARYAIEQIPVDGVLVTQQMKDLALNELKEYEAVQ